MESDETLHPAIFWGDALLRINKLQDTLRQKDEQISELVEALNKIRNTYSPIFHGEKVYTINPHFPDKYQEIAEEALSKYIERVKRLKNENT